MKRLLIAFVAILSLLACSKQEVSYKTVVFSLPAVQSGSMTKADAVAVSTALSAANPKTMPFITIQSTSVAGRCYKSRVGQSVTLPLDTYTVTGTYAPSTGIAKFLNLRISDEPSYKIEQTITVTEDSSVYELGVIYQCFALVIDSSVSSKYSFINEGGAVAPVTSFVFTDGIGVCFGVPSVSAPVYSLTVSPADEVNYEATTYRLGYGSGQGDIMLSYGKWYCFSPGEVTTQSGNLGIAYPEWEAGQ